MILDGTNQEYYSKWRVFSFLRPNLFSKEKIIPPLHHLAWKLNQALYIDLRKQEDMQVTIKKANLMLSVFVPFMDFVKTKDHQIRLVTFKGYTTAHVDPFGITDKENLFIKLHDDKRIILADIVYLLFFKGFEQEFSDEIITKQLEEKDNFPSLLCLKMSKYKLFKKFVMPIKNEITY